MNLNQTNRGEDMKKFIKLLSLILFIGLLTGCGPKEEYTFTIATGDTVTIGIDTSTGYSMTSTVPFKINRANLTVLTGNFIYMNEYNERVDSLDPDAETIKVIDSKKKKDNITYTLYLSQIDGYESDYIYLIKINDSNTGLILTSMPNANKDDVDKAFNSLSFSSVKSK